MLIIKPNCELCDIDLPADSNQARICSYECTFCASCVENELQNVCPNCGGGFVPRPIRPGTEYRPKVSRLHQLPSTQRVNTSYSHDDIEAFADSIKHLPPNER